MTTPHEGLTHLDAATSFEGSNIALLGSDIDHSLKSLSAHDEPAWKAPGIGSRAGVWAWVVQDFKVVPFKTGDLGAGGLQEGDSYIVLKSVAPVPSKPEVLIHDIWFWLGTKTSQDEAGVAAYKSVELDEFLGRSPTQHREVQGLETSSFLSLFHPHFITTLGGHASGFHHVDPTSIHIESPRLWEISQPGRKHVRVQEVNAVVESISRGDVFILDLGDKLLQWNGRESHPLEKAKGAETARHWVDARGGKATLQVFDDGRSDTAFFLALGVPSSSLPPSLLSKVAPLQPAPSTGTTVVSLLSTATSSPTSFSSSAFSLSSLLLIVPAHSPPTPAYIWVGQAVPVDETRFAFVRAQKLAGGRAIVAVKAGREGEEFKRDVGGA